MDAQDKTLRTPLLEAIVNNHIEVVKYLIQSGACVYHAVSLAQTDCCLSFELKLTCLSFRRRTVPPAFITLLNWEIWRW